MAISVTNKQICSKLLGHWLQLSKTRTRGNTAGFTLIELIVVMMIIGILSAIALPNVMGTIGRGREAEAKQTLSSMGRAQQAYFSENGQFADTLAKLDTSVQGKYYNFPEPITTPVRVKHRAESKAPDENNTREYEMGVYFENQGYITRLCQSASPGDAVQAPDTGTGSTCTTGTLLN